MRGETDREIKKDRETEKDRVALRSRKREKQSEIDRQSDRLGERNRNKEARISRSNLKTNKDKFIGCKSNKWLDDNKNDREDKNTYC